MTLSQARLKPRQLGNELIKLLDIFLARKPLIKGGGCLSQSKCGKPNCRCVREGKLHAVWKLYWTEGGKTKQIAIKNELIRAKSLAKFRLLGYYLIAIDGTGYYASWRRHCPHCLTRKKKTKRVKSG